MLAFINLVMAATLVSFEVVVVVAAEGSILDVEINSNAAGSEPVQPAVVVMTV